ncbi:unnamed protein product [Anisakis simplex]|uniref:Chromo domain-containing protein n=1 Tax=Anisakis simplex TaxID=6269 RepID=A0A0M3JYP5_ANISI|nr:unnamed protein product [Anisakis simplex]
MPTTGRFSGTTLQEYEVEEVLDVKREEGENQYLVHWKRYPLSASTWEPRSHFFVDPELMMQKSRSRSISKTRKSGGLPSQRNASKSPSRTKSTSTYSPLKSTTAVKSSKVDSVKKMLTLESSSKSPSRKKSASKSPSKKKSASKSPSKKKSASKSPSRKITSAKKRSPSKSPSRTTTKSSQKSKPVVRSRSQSRSGKLKGETKSASSLLPEPIVTPPKIYEPIRKSILPLSKQFQSSSSEPFTRSTVYPLRSQFHPLTDDSQSTLKQRKPPLKSSYTSVVNKIPSSKNISEYKKRIFQHLRYHNRFYIIVFMLLLIMFMLYYFGYRAEESMRSGIDAYVAYLKTLHQ